MICYKAYNLHQVDSQCHLLFAIHQVSAQQPSNNKSNLKHVTYSASLTNIILYILYKSLLHCICPRQVTISIAIGWPVEQFEDNRREKLSVHC